MERKPETLRVDSYSGVHRDQTGALPTDSGADPARLYRSQNSETKGQLIRGHYTRLRPSKQGKRAAFSFVVCKSLHMIYAACDQSSSGRVAYPKASRDRTSM